MRRQNEQVRADPHPAHRPAAGLAQFPPRQLDLYGGPKRPHGGLNLPCPAPACRSSPVPVPTPKSNMPQKEHSIRRRLGVAIAWIEIASLSSLPFLLGQRGLPPANGVLRVFLLPITFGLHIFEEFIFPRGAMDWFKIYRSQYAKAYTETYLFKVAALELVSE